SLSKRIGNCRVKFVSITDFLDGLYGCCEVSALVVENWCPRTNLRRTCGCIDISSEVVVEAPSPDGFSEKECFRRVSRIGDVRHHAVKRGEVLHDDIPIAVPISDSYKGALPVYQQ